MVLGPAVRGTTGPRILGPHVRGDILSCDSGKPWVIRSSINGKGRKFRVVFIRCYCNIHIGALTAVSIQT